MQNEYPTLGNAFTAVYSLVCVWLSDGPLRGRRWPVILFSNFIAIIIFTLLAVTPVMGPFSHRAPLYILSSIGGSMVPLTMAWMAELISDNAEQRAFTAASMNTLQCKLIQSSVAATTLTRYSYILGVDTTGMVPTGEAAIRYFGKQSRGRSRRAQYHHLFFDRFLSEE